ncbi:disulfide bond formation protein B [Paraburkholderia sp. SARCC-3016]|uniref:disulfide bond formation protein B n=1 Tax=Paraburkholderia sp. SARCC-3016 TaxID=3058611 RepID=UPI0028094E3F|nr:disulfide bond formation protein B [Paraburkholderia sp. SARCC-3016]MDQ7978765.1 disulfide bond formation protein B [Paraburkholderia sp. SARCC-3016]
MYNDNALLRRERNLLVLLALICVALVGGALYLQFVEHQDPCPLCIIQRYFYLLIAIFAFLGARLRGWRGVRLLEVLALLSAAGGVVTAARHVYIQAHPGFSCGFDALQPIVDGLPPARWLPSVFKVAGLCETPYPPILGISLPGWSLIGFVLAFLALAISLWRHRRAG